MTRASRSLGAACRTLAAALLLAASPHAGAGTCTASGLPTAFGVYDLLAVLPNLSTGSVSVVCQAVPVVAVQSYTVSLSTGGSGTYAARRLLSGAHTLQYQLYTDATRTTVWGDGSAGTATVANSFTLSVLVPVSANHIVYARMPAMQSGAAAGAYADTIIVTVTY